MSTGALADESSRLFGPGRVITGMALLRPFYEGRVSPVDGTCAARFSRNGHNGSGYHVAAVMRESKSYDAFSDIFYMDAGYGFVLHKENIPIAITSFGFLSDRLIYVVQIQGRKTEGREGDAYLQRAYEEIQKVRWQQLLLSPVVDWAGDRGVAQVRLQPAKKNKYYNIEPITAGGRKFNERLETHYDGTARSLGFAFNENESYYYLDL